MRKLGIALVLLALWGAATVLPALPRDGQLTDLTTLLSTGIDWVSSLRLWFWSSRSSFCAGTGLGWAPGGGRRTFCWPSRSCC